MSTPRCKHGVWGDLQLDISGSTEPDENGAYPVRFTFILDCAEGCTYETIIQERRAQMNWPDAL